MSWRLVWTAGLIGFTFGACNSEPSKVVDQGDRGVRDSKARDGADDGRQGTADGSRADGQGGDACPPQKVTGVGACKKLLGHYWDGRRCASLGGCSCDGADCKDLFKSAQACQLANKKCLCKAMNAKGVGDCLTARGVLWDGVECKTFGGCHCEGSDCKKIYEIGSAGAVQKRPRHLQLERGHR